MQHEPKERLWFRVVYRLWRWKLIPERFYIWAFLRELNYHVGPYVVARWKDEE